jgi:hypothetical protein
MFDPCLLATGFGALWCTDWEYPVLVRVDERDRTPQVWASWPAADGPQGLAAGPDAVWVLPGQGDQLLEIDPAGGGVTAHQVPFPLAGIAVGRGAVFGIGQLGDGRVLRFTPGGEARSALAGQARTLSLVAASAEYVWVVDDETATVLALDTGSLEPVQTFRQVGAPQALFARGAQAWYICAPEVAYQDEGGRQGRAVVLGPGWPTMDLLRLNAATGTAEQLRGLPGLASAAALIGDRLWVSGEQQEGPAEDPVTSLSCLDLDGRDISAIELPGQIDAIGASDSLVWVAGFRRSRQEDIVTVLDSGRAVLGDVSFGAVDVTPWAPPQADPVRRPLAERAQAIRDVLAAGLSQPRQAGNRFGDRWEEPPVSPQFQLERVDLRGSGDRYEIAVLFRWAGESDLFGMRFGITPEDDGEFDAPDGYISVHLEENLLAQGYGLANATRERADGITWLRWPLT